jgi:hypothetical protein
VAPNAVATNHDTCYDCGTAQRPSPSNLLDALSNVLKSGRDRARFVEALRVKFVTPVSVEWPVLFCPSDNDNEILTHLDVAHDPIIPELKHWIKKYNCSDPAPVYPAEDTPDRRFCLFPLPPLPTGEALWATVIDARVKPPMERWRESWDDGILEVVPVTAEPEPERRRQLERLAEWHPHGLTVGQVAECMNWEELRGDDEQRAFNRDAVRVITLRLLHPDRTGPQTGDRFVMKDALFALRTAVAFVYYLLEGGAMNLDCLVDDLEAQ